MKFGHSSVVYTTTQGKASGTGEVDLTMLEIQRLPVSLRFMQFDVAPSFPRAIIKEEFDILHAHGYREFLGTIGFVAARMKRRPFVLQPHGSLLGYTRILPERAWRPYTYYDRATWKAVLRKADRVVVATSQEFKEASRFGAPPNRIKVIPPGIAIPGVEKKPTTSPLKLLFVGRISPSRNVHDIIRAVAIAAKSVPVELSIVGGEERLSSWERPGYYQDLVTLSSDLGLSDRIKFTGPLYGQSLEEMYNTADVFVYVSSYESFGQPLLEAAAHRLPVISTPVGAAVDLVVPGKTGFLVEVGDVSAIAQHVLGIAENRNTLPAMGKRLIDIVRTKYDWTKILLAYRELYEQLAAR